MIKVKLCSWTSQDALHYLAIVPSWQYTGHQHSRTAAFMKRESTAYLIQLRALWISWSCVLCWAATINQLNWLKYIRTRDHLAKGSHRLWCQIGAQRLTGRQTGQWPFSHFPWLLRSTHFQTLASFFNLNYTPVKFSRLHGCDAIALTTSVHRHTGI